MWDFAGSKACHYSFWVATLPTKEANFPLGEEGGCMHNQSQGVTQTVTSRTRRYKASVPGKLENANIIKSISNNCQKHYLEY